MNLRTVTIGISSLVLLGTMGFVGTHASKDAWFYALMFFLPFYGFPPVVSILLSAMMKKVASQIILSIASILYGAWFAYAVYGSFYLHPDPQGGLIIIFVGIYFLPVLLPLWVIAGFMEWKAKSNARPGTARSTTSSPAPLEKQ